MNRFERITHDPHVMGDKACIRGVLITVSMILGQISGGVSIEALLSFPN